MAYDSGAWQNFYVMTGGAAAALTGLLFVAMSIHSKAIMAHPVFGSRAVTTLISLLTQLALAGVVLAPGQSVLVQGIEVETAALLSVLWSAISIWRVRQELVVSETRSAFRVTMEILGGSIWLILFLASGLSLILRVGGGFYLLAVVMLFMFGWNVYFCWSLIAEVGD